MVVLAFVKTAIDGVTCDHCIKIKERKIYVPLSYRNKVLGKCESVKYLKT